MQKIILVIFILTVPLSLAQEDLVRFVNPFIGTANGGNTFPGAVVPWGMVSVSPHTSLDSPSGYVFGEKYFYGFGHTHLSGTGCPDLGSIIITAADTIGGFTPQDYKTEYFNEYAKPGYYSVDLKGPKLHAEVTASIRTGFARFSSDSLVNTNILFDVGRSLDLVGGGSINILSDDEITGSNISGGFCGEDNRQTVFFTAKFNRPFSSFGIWVGDSITSKKDFSIKNSSLGCFLKYKIGPDNPLLIKVGISYTSIANARENMQLEIPDWNFDLVRITVSNMWNENLNRIIVESDDQKEKIKFYTALYHALIHPNIISDVSGDYPLMGRKGIGNYSNRNRYSVFSLWDTYRTLHPFLTLFYPERQSEIIKTMIDMYKENGFLPKWELAGNETYMMVGDPATTVIADSYIKGIRDFNIDTTLKAMLKPASLTEDEPAPPIRAGYHQLLKYKYIPFEQNHNDDWWVWGPVSTTLEYCFSDWTISQLAKYLGKEDLYNEFLNRSFNYKNLFDKQTLFMRPKLKNGNWLVPFDSLAKEGSGDWGGSGGPGFVEGNAWNYTWFVPHDIPGLIKLFGGEKIFSNKLQRAFSEKHFTIDNEPDISYPYLFSYIKGEESKTAKLVHSIMMNDFGTDADGLPGNDDCGTISAWYLFSAIGFYPVCPSDVSYRLGMPTFDKIKIKLNKKYYAGNEILIERKNSDQEKITFNDKILNDFQISHDQLVNGCRLIFDFKK